MTSRADANGRPDHAINIWDVDDAWYNSMQRKMEQMPRLLKEAAGGTSCCIFRIPQNLIEINHKAYQPQIVSIGPYHHGKEHLQMVEEHKWRILLSLISRTQENGLDLEGYLKAMMPFEERTRECYSEAIDLDRNELVQMLVLDGCFVVELLRKFCGVMTVEKDDPIFTMPWIFPFLMRDLLKLENQLPFFVLERLFDISKTSGDARNVSLALLALEFFNETMQRPEEVIERYWYLEGKHLLDLFRSSFLPLNKKEEREVNPSADLIPCVTKLKVAGIKFQPGIVESFLEIKFQNGALEIPPITIDDFTSCLFLNCIAFEQCHRHCSKHFTTYASFMDCIINTSKDVGFLMDDKIIENYFGTDKEVAHFFNEFGKDIAFDIQTCYLSRQFEEINEYYNNNWNVQWASFKNTYFNSPWSAMSAAAALILLLLTLGQTFFTVYAYFCPPS